jgi:hypothetical protein
MGTLLATYVLALAGAGIYAAWLILAAKRLAGRTERMNSLLGQSPDFADRSQVAPDKSA